MKPTFGALFGLLLLPASVLAIDKSQYDHSWEGTGIVPYTPKDRLADGEPTHCDGVKYHLCCLIYEGEVYTDRLTVRRCIPYKAIEKTDIKNDGVLTGGKCLHDHFCCKYVAKEEKFKYQKGDLKHVKKATRCRMVWSYNEELRNLLGFDEQARKMDEALKKSDRPQYQLPKPKVVVQVEDPEDQKENEAKKKGGKGGAGKRETR